MPKIPNFTLFFLNLFNFIYFKTLFCLTIFYLIDKEVRKKALSYNFVCVLGRKCVYAHAICLCKNKCNKCEDRQFDSQNNQ